MIELKNMSQRKASNKLRISENALKSIKRLLRKHFGENVRAWIFGSRTDIRAKGGDIDIYIEVPSTKGTFGKKLDFLVDLDKEIGEQKVDLVIRPYDSKDFISIEAKSSGVRIL